MKKIYIFAGLFALAAGLCPAQSPYYTGDGGKGKSITIARLDGVRLPENEAYLRDLVAGELSSNFGTFSAINPLNLADLERQIAVLYSGIFDDNDPALRLGHEASTDYMLTGTITRTSIGYNLQLTVRSNRDQSTRAAYSGTVTFDELDDLTGVRRASLELLQKMGVQLTARARAELAKPATSERVNAQIALAKSASATGFEKQYYTYQANQLDPTLTEAARRVAAYQTEIYKAPQINLAMPDIRIPDIRVPEFKAPEIRMAATGNIGADARRQQEQYNAQREASRARQESGNKALKDLQDAFLEQFKVQSEAVKKQQADLLKQRDSLLEQQKTLLARQGQMIAQLRETENSYDTFFNEHPPFEIIYDPAVKQVGTANLEKGTIDMQFAVASVGTQAMEVIPRMLADFEKGLGTITQGLRDINAELDKIESLIARAEQAGSNALWQLRNDYAAQVARVDAAENDYAAQLARLDTQLNTSGYAQLGRDYAVRPDTGYARNLAGQYAVQPAGYSAAKDKTLGSAWTLTKWNKDEQRTFVIEARLENDKGKTIGRATANLTNRISATAYTRPMSDRAFCVFREVPVNDITDTLKVSIQRVNNKNVTVAANAGYIKISPLEADGYTKDGWDIAGYGRDGYNKYGEWNRVGYDRYGYDKDGYDRDGYDRAGYNRYGEWNQVGYDKAGYDKDGRNRMGQTRAEVAEAERKAKAAWAEAEQKAAQAKAKQVANARFLRNSGINYTGGGGGGFSFSEERVELGDGEAEEEVDMGGGGGLGGGRAEIELRLFCFGLQTGFSFLRFQAQNKTIVQIPVLARINVMKYVDTRRGMTMSGYMSLYGGLGINLSSNPVSGIFGFEFGVTGVYFSLFGGMRIQRNSSSENYSGMEWYGGIGIFAPFDRNSKLSDWW